MSRETLGLLLGFAGVVIFGATLPAMRFAVSDLAPLFVTAGRAVVAAALALAYLALWRRPWPKRHQWLPLLGVAVFLVYGFPLLTALGMQTVPASRGGVVLGILPLATAAAAALIAGERPSAGFWLAALAGSALVIIFALRGDAGHGLGVGEVYLLAAVAVTGLGYTISAKLTREMGALDVIGWALIVSLPLSVSLAFWSQPADWRAVSSAAWAGFAYNGVFSMFLGFLFWNAGLAMGGIARVGQVQLLQTFVTIVVAALINRETVGLDVWAFALAVVATVLIGRRAQVKR
jgi:drug/metabolite transporter (DMT)-like permease